VEAFDVFCRDETDVIVTHQVFTAIHRHCILKGGAVNYLSIGQVNPSLPREDVGLIVGTIPPQLAQRTAAFSRFCDKGGHCWKRPIVRGTARHPYTDPRERSTRGYGLRKATRTVRSS
jgi:hypothetical protein